MAAAFPHCTDPKALRRFVNKIDVQADGCWIWTAARNHGGYGRFRLGKPKTAHRVAYIWATGEDIEGWEVDHRCQAVTGKPGNNPACVNPAHLRRVTKQQNQENRSGATKRSKSGVRGVCWAKQEQKWHAQVKHSGRVYNLGYFDSLDEAAEAARQGRLKYHTHNDADRTDPPMPEAVSE